MSEPNQIMAGSLILTDVLHAIQEAKRRIHPFIQNTPLEHSLSLSHLSDCQVYLKCEHLQHTGSFKFRGALSKLTKLSTNGSNLEVITASTGNHGLAVAFASQRLGIKATIYLPEATAQNKQHIMRALGATVVTVSGDGLQAELEARAAANASNVPFISPYNDIDVIAGQGTIGDELHNFSTFDAVFVSVGGGGLISGIGSYLKSVAPSTKIVGCWPENAPAMKQCLKTGHILEVNESPTLSTSTAGGVEPGSITFDLCQYIIDQCVTVSEEEIKYAMRFIAEHERYLIEGAAGVALAAFLKEAAKLNKKKVAIILCGRNLSMDQFNEVFRTD